MYQKCSVNYFWLLGGFGCSFETFADIDVKRMNIKNTVKFVTAVFVLLVCLWPDLCFSIITKKQKNTRFMPFGVWLFLFVRLRAGSFTSRPQRSTSVKPAPTPFPTLAHLLRPLVPMLTAWRSKMPARFCTSDWSQSERRTPKEPGRAGYENP